MEIRHNECGLRAPWSLVLPRKSAALLVLPKDVAVLLDTFVMENQLWATLPFISPFPLDSHLIVFSLGLGSLCGIVWQKVSVVFRVQRLQWWYRHYTSVGIKRL